MTTVGNAAHVLLALTAAVPLAAQNTWVVAPVLGPGVNFTTIQAAVNAASPGDTILVSPGTFAGFTASKPLRIQGQPAGQGAIINSTIEIGGIAQGEAFELAAFGLSGGPSGPGVRVANSAGVVLINVGAAGPWPPPPIPGIEALSASKVTVRGSTLMGSTFTNSTVVFENCTIHAREVSPVTPAITALNSKVLLTASRAQRFAPSGQIVQLTNSELFVSRDSQLWIQSGLPATVPTVNGTGTARVSPAASILPAGGLAYGPGIVSVTQTLDPLLVQQQTVTVRTGFGDLVAILVGLPGPTHDLPWVNGISWFDPTGPLLTMSLGVATTAATQVTLPYTPGTNPHLPLTWLALTGNATAGIAITNPNGMILQ